ncbi:2-oxoglutarate dehydrogenase subunit E1, partial [bacterium]|nr:2-oxoglutarate dehydrogenase subunit E1 [bacterium]
KALGLDTIPANQVFYTGDFLGGTNLPLSEILSKLKSIYCNTIGVEYTHIQDGDRRRWLQERVESSGLRANYDAATRRFFLRTIVQGEQFERFLHRTFVGAKRFSIEGGESLLAAIERVIQRAPGLSISDIIIGMAHRGRLNVLVNVLGKKPEQLFKAFSESYVPDTTNGDGDVKYHLGYENSRTVDGKSVALTLAYNPSHLEAVNPVALGRARARVDLQNGSNRSELLPILVHGDAAFAGQGIVMETLNLSGVKGYSVGGTLHFVTNNQVGFTTNPDEARTGRHCTEINEADEPLFTQPILYKSISSHPTVSELYAKRLVESGSAPDGELMSLRNEFDVTLNAAQERAVAAAKKEEEQNKGAPSLLRPFKSPYDTSVETKAAKELIDKVAPSLWQMPPDFSPNHKIKRSLDIRAEAFKSGVNFDWTLGEALAFGTLLAEGHPIRISGQDCERGTFAHRHAVLHDPSNDAEYTPLNSVAGGESIELVNSTLSEYAVLGFDYGYSLEAPDSLVIWEAQFGFSNGAQIIIDQFIASAESKWGQTSGLVLLLPHGYEGQGPEHSSARLERYLQLCAENNIQVIQPSTPAQLFHALRRQVKSEHRKPLVVMTPKSLLRHKACVSVLTDFTQGSFQAFLPDSTPATKTERLLICSGKVFYDLEADRVQRKDTTTTIVRAEQFYPFDAATIKKLYQQYGSPVKVVWVQDEPQNMGAWTFIAPLLESTLGVKPLYAGRDAAASPAVGALSVHRLEQADLIKQAFSI